MGREEKWNQYGATNVERFWRLSNPPTRRVLSSYRSVNWKRLYNMRRSFSVELDQRLARYLYERHTKIWMG
jgi:hypothetical protein